MRIISKIKGLCPEKRRAAVFVLIILLALPLLFLIFARFADRMGTIKDNIRVEELKLP